MTASIPVCEDIEVETPQDLTALLAASLRDMVTHIEAHQASLAPSNRGCYCAEFDRDERARETEESRG